MKSGSSMSGHYQVLIWCQTGGVAVRGCGSSGEFSVSEDGGILRLEGRNQHGVSS